MNVLLLPVLMSMIQIPFPSGDTTEINVSLPSGFEQWRDLYLHDVGEKVIVFAVLALVFYFLSRLARRQVREQIGDINRRHAIRKGIKYGYVLLLVLTAVALFADALAGFGTVLALILAGVAVALQDVLKSVVGWIYVSTRSGVEVGSRVEVDGVTGDVIDIGVLKTTVLEIGNLVYGRQSTGRLVTIPNYRMLAGSVLFSSPENLFIWQELKFLVTYESDWQRAEAVMREIADEFHAELAPELARGFRAMERRYAFKYGKLTPIVYVVAAASGVELTVRFLTHDRRRRGSSDRITRRVLAAFERESNVDLAYPTWRIYRPGEGGGAGRSPRGEEL